jgi:tRNA U34 5-methylaminomethyl-2-thiouridine-forming methyltransferase MnmC
MIENGNPLLFKNIHDAHWNLEVNITPNFSILKLSADLLMLDFSALPFFDLIYYDAFSPEKQPELWETSVFKRIANHCNPDAKIVTYCAKGAVRRSMKEAGFIPERIPGPPGKREMLRGTKSK